MIQANELRIGNIISDIIDLEKNLIVYKLENGIVTCGDEDFTHPYLAETLKPLELTPEILEKCGFVNVGDEFSNYRMEIKNSGFIDIAEDNSFSVGDISSIGSGLYFAASKPACLKGLHSLQNLYFALTGEELNVQL